jgi:hypothetical protein
MAFNHVPKEANPYFSILYTMASDLEKKRSPMEPYTARRFYLVTYPRTGSNLLVRMLGLENQPHIRTGDDRGGYIFLPAVKLITDLGLRKKDIVYWTEKEITEVRRTYQECFDQLQGYLDEASADGCSVFIKEHVHFLIDPATLSKYAFGSSAQDINRPSWIVQDGKKAASTRSPLNDTLIPDEFLRGWYPTFLIRHPALAFPSLYRALLELEGTGNPNEDEYLGQHCMTLRWTRNLHDWYLRECNRSESNIIRPIVLDADDIMMDPKLVSKYCRLVGMDPSCVSFSWMPASEEQCSQVDPFTKRYLNTLMASEGIVANKIAGNVNIEKETEEWCREFGERAGRRLGQLVWESMPDYKFLKARRLRTGRS